MRLRVLTLAMSALLLTGCGNHKQWFQSLVPKDEDAFARRFLDLVRTGQLDAANGMLDPSLTKDDSRGALAQVQQLLSREEVLEIEPVGLNLVGMDDRTRTFLTYQIRFLNSWMLAEVVVDKVGNKLFVVGFHVTPLPSSLGEINAFTLKGKSLSHYLALAVVLFIPIFLISTVVLIIRSKVRRKWLWIPFMFIGLCQFSFNWTTSELGFQLIWFQIPGVGFYRPGLYGPWSLFASIPVGAIIFLINRKKLERRRRVEQGDGSVAPDIAVPSESKETMVAFNDIVVAEVFFDRNAQPQELRRLGEALEACLHTEAWIVRISGLDDLLKGECPQQFSKAIGNFETGEIVPVSYDPILVWARADYPDRETTDPLAILRAKIPAELASVSYPDPDNGL